jgi:aryl-alcohol dehydrogenase-like predicted oxidoreductase
MRIAGDAGMTMPTLALAWVLRRSELASAIIGASRPEQVHANVTASGVELGDDMLTAIDAALGDVPVRGQTLGALATEGVTHRRVGLGGAASRA